MVHFTKPSLNFQQKIALLQAKGMAVPDAAKAEHWLRHVSYYRLSAYWLPFEHPKGQAGPRFPPGTHFDTVVALYEFDRHLRLLMLDAIERIEVAIRGSWAYALAHQGGPHAYLNVALYGNPAQFRKLRAQLVESVRTSPETYVVHYRNKYTKPRLPPVWMIAEIMSFGQLSRWYANLASRPLRNQVAQPFALSEAVFVPLIRHLTTVRNTCAHHGRLWNRGFLIRPVMPMKPANLAVTLAPPGQGPAKLYNTIVMLVFLLQQVEPGSTWKDEMKALLAAHPTTDLTAMGFPGHWDQRPLWL